MAHYQGPESGGIGHRVGHISSFEQHGGAFKTKSFGFGAGLSAQNRSGVVNWEGNSTPPGFQQN